MSKITSEQIEQVLNLMEDGSSERNACETVGINRATFRSAALKNHAADHYARALVGMAADQIEKMEQTIEDMRSKVVDPQMARVEIDARKWFASKLLPKTYGEHVDLTTGGEKLGPSVVIYRPEKLTDDILVE